MDNLGWLYKEDIFEEKDIGENYGFVYLITNMETNKKYIGKKLFYSSKTKTVKGKKKRYKVASDWQSYYGSNTELQDDVRMHGQSKFKREILYLCKTKSECSYLEAREQFTKNVLESDDYYNSWIMVRVRKSNLKTL
jgi:hypothetical protein